MFFGIYKNLFQIHFLYITYIMVKARKVHTPGSGKGFSPGRPKKKKVTGRPVKYRGKYNEENLKQAVKEVREHRMSYGQAAAEFGVPKATLHDRVKEKVSETAGRPTVLSKLEETLLVERLLVMGQWGFPLTRRELCNIIKIYLDGLGRTTRKKHLPYLPNTKFYTNVLLVPVRRNYGNEGGVGIINLLL
jgi:transposase-like protein